MPISLQKYAYNLDIDNTDGSEPIKAFDSRNFALSTEEMDEKEIIPTLPHQNSRTHSNFIQSKQLLIYSSAFKLHGGRKIFIKCLNGKTITLEIDVDNDTIAEIKQIIQEKEGLAAGQIRLIFAGKELLDSNTLSFFNYQKGSVLHLVMKIRGG